MRFLIKLTASTVGVLCTTASAYFLVDEKKRHGVVLAATAVQSPSETPVNLSKGDYRPASAPIQSSEAWNWNWDGYVRSVDPLSGVRLITSVQLVGIQR